MTHFSEIRLAQFKYFVNERYKIFLKKEKFEPKPWTTDEILQKYRFCNVHRENDTVTRWLRENWRDPHTNDPYLWFAMAVARFVNWPRTLNYIGYPVPWNKDKFLRGIFTAQKKEGKVFTGAYMIRSDKMPKAEYLAERVFTPLWNKRREMTVKLCQLNELYDWLRYQNGFGSFLAAQVVADAKYHGIFRYASDWHTFAAPGPGSKRGLNLVIGLGRAGQRVESGIMDQPWRESDWRAALLDLKAEMDPYFKQRQIPVVHAQDLQNCLCEYSKYVRGYSRSKYPGEK